MKLFTRSARISQKKFVSWEVHLWDVHSFSISLCSIWFDFQFKFDIFSNLSVFFVKNQTTTKSSSYVILTVCSYHVTYAFPSESTLYSCLNVKEFLAQNRREIWSLSDCNGTRTHKHLVRNRTLNHLIGWVFVYELRSCGFE